jgi:hypothetical protein
MTPDAAVARSRPAGLSDEEKIGWFYAQLSVWLALLVGQCIWQTNFGVISCPSGR